MEGDHLSLTIKATHQIRTKKMCNFISSSDFGVRPVHFQGQGLSYVETRCCFLVGKSAWISCMRRLSFPSNLETLVRQGRNNDLGSCDMINPLWSCITKNLYWKSCTALVVAARAGRQEQRRVVANNMARYAQDRTAESWQSTALGPIA